MKNILSLNEFLSNVHDEDLEKLNEGIFTNLFGALFGKDMWSTVKGDSSIKKEFRDIDERISGFSLVKIKNPNASQNIRQTLVDWASDIYEKKSEIKEKEDVELKDLLVSLKDKKDEEKTDEEKEAKKVMDDLKKSLDDIEKKYQKKIDEFTQDPDLKRWTNLLKEHMGDIIDKLLCGKYDEEKKLAKDLEKAQKKKLERLEKKNKELEREQKEQLEKISKERNDVIIKCGAKPFDSNKKASDFLKSVANEIKIDGLFEDNSVFDGKHRVVIDKFKNSKLKELLGIDENVDENKIFETLRYLNDIILSNVEKDFEKSFGDINAVSMQAAAVSYCNLLLSCIGEETKLDDSMKLCMARCAVLKNTLVGFGLPYPDEMENKKEDDRKSLFAFYVNKTIEEWNKNQEMKQSVDKLDSLCKEIITKAKDLIDEYNKEQEQKEKKEEREQEKEDNK